MKKYNTRIIAEVGIEEAIIKAIINNPSIVSNADLFIQDIIENESIVQIDMIITDHMSKNSDLLITSLIDVVGNDLMNEVIELVKTITEAADDGFDNLIIYNS